MRHTTLTSVDQLGDFVPGITEYVVIYYQDENTSNYYFGNYDESIQLGDNNVIVERRMITDSRVGVNGDLISYMLNASSMESSDNIISISYRQDDIQDDNIRIDIFESDTQVLLVIYHRYIDNHRRNPMNIENVNIQNNNENNLPNMNEMNNLQNLDQNMGNIDNDWNMIQQNNRQNMERNPQNMEDEDILED